MRDVILPCHVCRALLPAAAAMRVREAPLRPATVLHWECFDLWMRRLLRRSPARAPQSPGAQPLPRPDTDR